MAVDRQAVPDVPLAGEGAVAIEPPAHQRIYEYYVRPPTPAPSPLHEVAAALGPLSNDLFSLASTQAGQKNKADAAQADLDFVNKNADGYKVATQDGLIPPDHSPAYMHQFGANAGLNDASNLKQSIGPGYEQFDKTSDPKDFDKWFFGQAAGNANQDLNKNSGYAQAYGRGIMQLHQELSNQFTQDRSKAIKGAAVSTYGDAIGNTINEHWPTGASDLDSQKLAATLGFIRDRAVASGMDLATANKTAVDMIALRAIDHKSPAVLNVLDGLARDPNDPTGTKLGGDEYGLAKKIETAHTVQTLQLQQRAQQQAQQKIADESTYKATVTPILQKWAGTDPNYVPSQAEIADASKHDPLFATKIGNYRKAILTDNVIEDPQEKASLYEDMLRNGGGQQKVLDAIGMGVLKTPTAIKEAMEYGNLVENYNKGGGAAKVMDDPAFKRYVAVIQSSTKDPKWVSSIDGNTGVTLDGRNAINDLSRVAMEWQTKNPNAGPLERQKFLQTLGEGIMKNIQGMDNQDFSQHKYTPIDPAQILGAGAAGTPPVELPPAQRVPAQQAPPQNAPAASPEAPGRQGSADPAGGDLRAWLKGLPEPPRLEGLSPDAREKIGSAAKQLGMEPQAVINEMWKRSAAPDVPGKRSDAADTVDQMQTADATGSAMNPQPVSFQMPDGGRVDLHGVSPEVARQIEHMTGLMGRLAGQPAAAPARAASTDTGADHSNAGPSEVNPNRVASIDAMPVRSTIEKVAKETGFDVNRLKGMVSIESGGRSGQTTGSYHGLLQLSKAEFAKYGKGDIENDEDNLRAGVAALQDKEAKFATQFGRKPSATELYLMHQQGEGGLRAHEAAPNSPAWENMASTREGQQKGDAWAKKAVWGNVPSDMKRQFGSVDNMTSAEFMAVWQHKLEGTPYTQALAQIKSRSSLAER